MAVEAIAMSDLIEGHTPMRELTEGAWTVLLRANKAMLGWLTKAPRGTRPGEQTVSTYMFEPQSDEKGQIDPPHVILPSEIADGKAIFLEPQQAFTGSEFEPDPSAIGQLF